MAGEGSFLVEDFINAIAAQLDRVQDSLRVKAVNRPLTYALRDFSLDLQVFVDMDMEGNVRFRSSAPNETGASTIRLGFTTITKPMIEENTISLAMTRSPGLDELGLTKDERKKLEQFGVNNAAQLKRLGSLTGHASVSRLSGIPIDRLRAALQLGSPQVSHVQPEPGHGPQTGPATGGHGSTGAPARPAPTHPPVVSPPPRPRPDVGPVFQPASPLPHRAVVGGPALHGVQPVAPTVREAVAAPVLRVAPNIGHLRLSGRNLISDDGPPSVRLNGLALSLAHADDDHVIVALPEGEGGMLEVELPDGQTQTYRLELAHGAEAELASAGDAVGGDPWAPPVGGPAAWNQGQP